MKKFSTILLVLTLLLSLCTVNVCAADDIKVIIDITNVKFDVPPTIINGRTLVPLRAIFEALGATVEWDDATQTVTSEKGETKISLTINSNIMTVSGEEKTLDVPATLIDSRTLVPVRAISESFGLAVGWDGDNNIVSILSDTETFTMLYAKNSRSRVFAKSSAATQKTHGWYEYPVTAVYSADGKESVVATDEAQSYLDSGYYAYPVKTIFTKDGVETVIRAEKFNAYLANGYLAERPVIAVEGEEEINAIDYTEYGDVTEEQLAIIATAGLIKRHRYPKTTTLHSIYGGYYNDEYLVVINMTTQNGLGRYFKYDAVVRLENDSKVTILYDLFDKGGDGELGMWQVWAKDLIPQKTTLFKNYSSNEIKDSIMELALK